MIQTAEEMRLAIKRNRFTGLESERRPKMIEVSKERFYSLIYEKRLNVHPRPETDKTYWEMQDGSRKLFGVSTPGYKEPGKIKTYKVSPDFEGGQ